jgi:ribosomal protein S18 acetylase RimI-like enzyme
MHTQKTLMTNLPSSEPYLLEFTDELESKGEMMLLNGINSYGREKKGMSQIELFGIFLKDIHGKRVGGLSGMFCYGCMHIDMLWIDGSVRGNGWGKKIVEEAETQALKRGCNFATLETMDWEALPFYQKLGFFIEFVRKGYQKNSTMYLLRKQFTPKACEINHPNGAKVAINGL